MDLALIVRGLAAFQVLVWHTVGFDVTGGVWSIVNVSGTQCVWMFFTLSGYLVSYGFVSGRYDAEKARDVTSYVLARVLRIVPLYALVGVATFVALSIRDGTWVHPGSLDWGRLAASLTFVDTAKAIPGLFWTLVLEMRFYALVPAIVWLLRRARVGLTTQLVIYALLVCVPLIHFYTIRPSLDDRTMLGCASHFFAGYIVHDIWIMSAQPESRRASTIPGLAFVGLVALGYTTYLSHESRIAFWLAGSVLSDVSAVCMLLVHKCLEERRALAGPVSIGLGMLGTLAYGIYGWHGALLMIVPSMVGHLAVVASATLALSALSYRFVERPALGLRRRLIRRDYIGLPG